MRTVKVEEREHGKAEQKTAQQDECIVPGNIQTIELEGIKRHPAGNHHHGVQNALDQLQDAGVFLKQTARTHVSPFLSGACQTDSDGKISSF
jgi:hypothetical protein